MREFAKIAIISGTLLLGSALFAIAILFEVMGNGVTPNFYKGLACFIFFIILTVIYIRKIMK